MWKGVLLVDFTICLKLRCLLLILLIAMHNRYLILSIIEVPYDKLTKYLNSALTKLFSTSVIGLETEEKQKLKHFSFFFLYLNLYDLLKMAYSHLKFYIFWNYTCKCVKK